MALFEVIKEQFDIGESDQAGHLSSIKNIGSSNFSFKADDKAVMLSIVPKSFKKYLGADSQATGYGSYNEFLNHVPSIEIREFGVKNTASYIASWMSWAKESHDMAMKSDSILNDASNALKNAYDTAKVMFSRAGVKALIDAIGAAVGGVSSSILGGQPGGMYLTTVPFALYYGLTTTKTNAYYRLPMMSDKFKLESDGHYGWSKSGNLFDGLGTIGNFIAQAFKIRCDITPQFKPDGNSNSPDLTIELDLINDTLESAKNNTKFVYSLIGKNRWLQHGIIQSSASLYDIKLPSGIRYFMCSGSFTCDAKGSMRYINGFHKIGENDNILIPDAYTLKLSFKSLLPDNFNTFFWSFSASKPMKAITGSTSVQDKIFPAIEEELGKAKTEMAGRNIVKNKESIKNDGDEKVDKAVDELESAQNELDEARKNASMSAAEVKSDLINKSIEKAENENAAELNNKETALQKLQSEEQQIQAEIDELNRQQDLNLMEHGSLGMSALQGEKRQELELKLQDIKYRKESMQYEIDEFRNEIRSNAIANITDETVKNQMDSFAEAEITARDNFIAKKGEYDKVVADSADNAPANAAKDAGEKT